MLSVNVQFRSLLLCAILEQTCGRLMGSHWFRFWGHCELYTFFVMIYPNLEKLGDNLETDFFSPALLQTADRNMAKCPTGFIQQGKMQHRDTKMAEGLCLHKNVLTCGAAAVILASEEINLC